MEYLLRQSPAPLQHLDQIRRDPPFQPNDLFPFVRFLDQQRINFILVARRFARRFADINDFSVVPRPAERLGICKVIVDDHVRILDALFGMQCYQAEVARAGTNEVNRTSLTHAHLESRSLARRPVLAIDSRAAPLDVPTHDDCIPLQPPMVLLIDQ